MSAADIQARLRTLFEANKAITTLTTKLAKYGSSPPIPTANPDASHLPSTPSPSGDSRLELSAEIHQSLRDLEEDYEALKQDAEDFTAASLATPTGRATARRDPEKEQARLAVATQLGRLGEDIRLSRAQFRKAQLQAKAAEELARRNQERARLFLNLEGEDASDGGAAAGKRRRGLGDKQATQDELLVGAAGDVTLALRRTHQLMQVELQRSEFAHETLQRSTAALEDLSQNYQGLDSLLTRSRGLIKVLRTSEKSDTWYLETALYVLLATFAWLVFRRVAYYPLYYLAYIPSRWVLNLLFALANATLGVFVGGAGAAPSAGGSCSLKVRPSATGKGAVRDPGAAMPSMNVGGGGKAGSDGAAGEMSEQVGSMAEQTRQQEQQQQQQQQQQQGGTVLRERRPDEPVNPKKRMWEEPVAAKDDQTKDEL